MYILNFEAFLVAITLLTITPGIDTVLVIKIPVVLAVEMV